MMIKYDIFYLLTYILTAYLYLVYTFCFNQLYCLEFFRITIDSTYRNLSPSILSIC